MNCFVDAPDLGQALVHAVLPRIRPEPVKYQRRRNNSVLNRDDPPGDTSRNGNLRTFKDNRCNVVNDLGERRRGILASKSGATSISILRITNDLCELIPP